MIACDRCGKYIGYNKEIRLWVLDSGWPAVSLCENCFDEFKAFILENPNFLKREEEND